MINLKGKFNYQIFKSDNYGVYIFISHNEYGKVTVTGNFLDIIEGQEYELEGDFIDHPRFGSQFKCANYKIIKPTEKDTAIRFLSSSYFKGIGKKYATTIVEELGDNCLEKIEADFSILDNISKMTSTRKSAIINGFNDLNNTSNNRLNFYLTHNIGSKLILKLEKLYGDEVVAILEKNPYRMIYEINGVAFKTADKIGMSLGFDLDNSDRLNALLLSLIIESNFKSGDSFVSDNDLNSLYYKKTSLDNYLDVKDRCLNEKIIMEVANKIYAVSQFEAETYISEFLNLFPITKISKASKAEIDRQINDIQILFNIEYDNLQKEAMMASFDNDLLILTGGPGTGKTTIVRAIVQLFKNIYPNYNLMALAPTGRAAKRISELCNVKANTIHSALSWDLESNTFAKNEENPLLVDFIIIDEFSMVDNHLFYSLLRASKEAKKIIIIGDSDQLPSVAPGALLRDLLSISDIASIRLTTIYRQQEGSEIVELANSILNSSVNFTNYHNNVSFFEIDNSQIKKQVCKVATIAQEKGYDLSEIQILAPKYAGINGIDSLNLQLQNIFNPLKNEFEQIKYGYKRFRLNDKVLQLKNRTEDDVYNGDIGFVSEIIGKEESEFKQDTLVVNFNGNYVYYPGDAMDELYLAYCISIHKSQGSEYPIVILPISNEYNYMLTKRLLYTAITRCKQSLVLIGSKRVFDDAIKRNERHVRSTTLIDFYENYNNQDDVSENSNLEDDTPFIL